VTPGGREGRRKCGRWGTHSLPGLCWWYHKLYLYENLY
jgi:hypothetical protein